MMMAYLKSGLEEVCKKLAISFVSLFVCIRSVQSLVMLFLKLLITSYLSFFSFVLNYFYIFCDVADTELPSAHACRSAQTEKPSFFFFFCVVHHIFRSFFRNIYLLFFVTVADTVISSDHTCLQCVGQSKNNQKNTLYLILLDFSLHLASAFSYS